MRRTSWVNLFSRDRRIRAWCLCPSRLYSHQHGHRRHLPVQPSMSFVGSPILVYHRMHAASFTGPRCIAYSVLKPFSPSINGIVMLSIFSILTNLPDSIIIITLSICASTPWISIVTEPSYSFRHQPVQLQSSAACRARYLKPTPCTHP